MPYLFQSACIAALVTGGLARAGTINDSTQNPDPSYLSSWTDGSSDHAMASGDSQTGRSNQGLPQGTTPNLIQVQTDAVPMVPEPSTIVLIGGAACAALIGRPQFARR